MPHEFVTRWKNDTSRFGKSRGDVLEAVDKEVARLYELAPTWTRNSESPMTQYLLKRLKIALNDWTASKGALWANDPRNGTGIIGRLHAQVTRAYPGVAVKHASYKVPRSPHTPDTERRLRYGHQSKMMNCWWQCAKMALDYHVGEPARRQLMAPANAPAAKRIYDANNGVKWATADGLLAQAELRLMEANLQNQSASWFSTEDIMTGLQQYGPLLFSGMFVRAFGIRFRSYGHVILVYGVDYDKVWYHDPAVGLEVAKASISLDFDTFKNGWNPRASKMLTVHAVDPAFVRAKAAEVALAAQVADMMAIEWEA
jgi:hypothetical protein